MTKSERSEQQKSSRLSTTLQLLALTLLFLSGCVTLGTKQPPLTSDYCRLYVPVCYNSRVDSQRTIDQILKNEVVHASKCKQQFERHQCPPSVSAP